MASIKRGDEMKCDNRDMHEYGDTAYVDRFENGQIYFFGGRRIRNEVPYDPGDFVKVGVHPRIGQGLFGSDKW